MTVEYVSLRNYFDKVKEDIEFNFMGTSCLNDLNKRPMVV